MQSFYISLIENPLQYIEYVFALMAGIGAVLFFAGWGTGMPHIFNFSESDTHMAHSRARATWGVVLCMVTFGWWELLRVILGQVPLSYLWLVALLLTPIWIPWVKGLLGGGKSGH